MRYSPKRRWNCLIESHWHPEQTCPTWCSTPILLSVMKHKRSQWNLLQQFAAAHLDFLTIWPFSDYFLNDSGCLSKQRRKREQRERSLASLEGKFQLKEKELKGGASPLVAAPASGSTRCCSTCEQESSWSRCAVRVYCLHQNKEPDLGVLCTATCSLLSV